MYFIHLLLPAYQLQFSCCVSHALSPLFATPFKFTSFWDLLDLLLWSRDIIIVSPLATSAYIRKYANVPARPAKVKLPDKCDAAPVEEAGVPDAVPDGDVDVVFSVRLPPVPALTVGDTLLSASADAFLKAAKVLAPVAL
jgi:hypothetical protein